MTLARDILLIEQGTTRTIVLHKLRDARKQPLDPTGWTIRAEAHLVPGTDTMVATWSDAPDSEAGELLAEVVDADPLVLPADDGEKWIYLHIPHATSSEWTWSGTLAHLHIEITDPGGEHRERFARRLSLDPEIII